MNLIYRPRRIRQNSVIRNMVRENHIRVEDFIYPMFIVEGTGVKNPISSMPGIYQFSIDEILKELKEVKALGILAINLFGVPSQKDETGKYAHEKDGLVQKAIKEIKAKFPEMMVMTDVCLCDYMSHGHCGIIHDHAVVNDETVDILVQVALSHVEAGADMVSPSDMMDGRIGAIRDGLDDHGFSHIPIMAYSAKYASAFYGPFREAANNTPQFGDRAGYQMDVANSREAMKETILDVEEGADIVMVKPALAYLDIVRQLYEEVDIPIAAYNVSGEYSMVKAAAQNGWIDGDRAMMESLLSIKRAGASIILTYFAKDAARILNGG